MHRAALTVVFVTTAFALASAAPANAGDFNGDGFDDLAIGVPGAADSAGAVKVIYGTAAGLAAATEVDTLTLASFGLVADEEEGFGSALAVADFDADGFDDLAIGVSGRSIGSAYLAGVVVVMRGGAAGLDAATAKLFSQNSKGIADRCEYKHGLPEDKFEELFGHTLCAGDFNADGFADLAIGVVETLGKGAKEVIAAGAVHVLYGSGKGLRAKKSQFWHLGSKGVPGSPTQYGRLGWLGLAAGDFDGNGADDLAMRCSAGGIGKNFVVVLYGRAKKGLKAKHAQLFDELGLDPAQAEFSSNFGSALAAGDFDGDGFDELAIGNSSRDLGGFTDAGQVDVVRGTAAGLDPTQVSIWNRTVALAEGAIASSQFFGGRLIAGRFNGDAYDDLAVGIPEQDWNGVQSCGAVQVFPGSSFGLNTLFDVLLHQDVGGIPSAGEDQDQMGQALAVGRWNPDAVDDLAIGVPGQDVGGLNRAGAVLVLFGEAQSGMQTNTGLFFTAATPIMNSIAEAGASFGSEVGS